MSQPATTCRSSPSGSQCMQPWKYEHASLTWTWLMMNTGLGPYGRSWRFSTASYCAASSNLRNWCATGPWIALQIGLGSRAHSNGETFASLPLTHLSQRVSPSVSASKACTGWTTASRSTGSIASYKHTCHATPPSHMHRGNVPRGILCLQPSWVQIAHGYRAHALRWAEVRLLLHDDFSASPLDLSRFVPFGEVCNGSNL